MNTYGYVDGNPVNYIDPFGLAPAIPFGGTGAVVGAPGVSSNNSLSFGTTGNQSAASALDNFLKNTVNNWMALGAVLNALHNTNANTNSTPSKQCKNNRNDEDCSKLNERVQNAKNKVGRLGACRSGMTRYALMVRKQAWLELATARAVRDQKCWNGGDLGHQQAQASAWRHVGICSSLMK